MRNNKINGFGHPVRKLKLYDFPAIEKARAIIEKDPANHLVLSRLADEAGINEYKLKIGFRELFETSPYQYLLSLRLAKARELLEDTDYTIQEIADKIGFESYNGFSAAFKNAFRLSPTHYRNSLWEEK